MSTQTTYQNPHKCYYTLNIFTCEHRTWTKKPRITHVFPCPKVSNPTRRCGNIDILVKRIDHGGPCGNCNARAPAGGGILQFAAMEGAGVKGAAESEFEILFRKRELEKGVEWRSDFEWLRRKDRDTTEGLGVWGEESIAGPSVEKKTAQEQKSEKTEGKKSEKAREMKTEKNKVEKAKENNEVLKQAELVEKSKKIEISKDKERNTMKGKKSEFEDCKTYRGGKLIPTPPPPPQVIDTKTKSPKPTQTDLTPRTPPNQDVWVKTPSGPSPTSNNGKSPLPTTLSKSWILPKIFGGCKPSPAIPTPVIKQVKRAGFEEPENLGRWVETRDDPDWVIMCNEEKEEDFWQDGDSGNGSVEGEQWVHVKDAELKKDG